MARKKKESEAITFRIRKDIMERLRAYSERTDVPMTAVVDRALDKWLGENDAEER